MFTNVCLVAAYPLVVLSQLPESSSFPVSTEHPGKGCFFPPGHYASLWVSCGRKDSEFWLTVLNTSFWTGGCEQRGQGPTALSFQESEVCSHHLIFQCSFFSEHQEDKMPQWSAISLPISKTHHITTFPSGRITGSISLVGICCKCLAL